MTLEGLRPSAVIECVPKENFMVQQLLRFREDIFLNYILGACRELAPSMQESTTYEPSLVCKLLILGCRPLIPDRLLENFLGDLGKFASVLRTEPGSRTGRLRVEFSRAPSACKTSESPTPFGFSTRFSDLFRVL